MTSEPSDKAAYVKPNVRRGRCEYDCRTTWHDEHGGSVPGGPFPGTSGSPGDVRRCEHGRVWTFDHSFENGFYCRMDRWRRVSRLWEPRLYRRAVAALSGEERAGVRTF